jgi:hypothetical protein
VYYLSQYQQRGSLMTDETNAQQQPAQQQEQTERDKLVARMQDALAFIQGTFNYTLSQLDMAKEIDSLRNEKRIAIEMLGYKELILEKTTADLNKARVDRHTLLELVQGHNIRMKDLNMPEHIITGIEDAISDECTSPPKA